MSGGTTIDSGCNIKGDFLSCPADSEFEFNGAKKVLDAFLECPLDSVAQSEFVEASQQGKCQCSAALRDKEQTPDQAQPIDCDCFACPVGSTFGFSYECDRPILFNCKTFNCFGQCNGEFNAGIGFVTEAPTAVPGGVSANGASAAANLSSSPVTTAALALLLIIKLFR